MRPSHHRRLRALPAVNAKRLGLWLARWVLVLVLAFDQVGSPLHRHHHDSGVDGQWSSAQPEETLSGDQHLEDADSIQPVSHAVLAVRPRSETFASNMDDGGVAPVAPAWFEQPLEVSKEVVRIDPWPERYPPPFRSHRSLPPAGRAPPFHT